MPGRWKGMGQWALASPLDFEIWHFPITFLAKKVVSLVSRGDAKNYLLFPFHGKIFVATSGKQLPRKKVFPTPMHAWTDKRYRKQIYYIVDRIHAFTLRKVPNDLSTVHVVSEWIRAIPISDGQLEANQRASAFREILHSYCFSYHNGFFKFVKALLQTHSCFFALITPSALLSRCITCRDFLSSTATCGKRPTTVSQGGQTFWPEGRIRDCLPTGGPDTVRFAWQTAANAVVLLSTVGNVVLEKNVQGFGGPD